MSSASIVAYRPELAQAFAQLNQEWIERFFAMEASDVRMLHDPEGSILSAGGQIFFALDGDTAVGTVAAVRTSASRFELAKMAVRPSHQGRGIGEMLGRAAIAHAREAGASMIALETNRVLHSAIRLYERLGFAHATPPHPSPYARSDVYMELRFDRR
jgi:putative acetyltransferase